MRVLFVSRSNIGLSRGGLQKQIRKTAEGLENNGIEVIFYNPWKNQIKEVDICHCWGSDPQMIYFVREAKRNKVPVVISPVFMRFSERLWLVKIEYWAGVFIRGLFTPQGLIYKMFRACDKIIALNKEEEDILKHVFRLHPETTSVIPNGIEKKFADGDPELFIKKYGVSDFVLQVGYIEERKNLLTTIKAMKGLPYKLVVVGGWEMRNEKYVKRCKAEGGDNVLFTGYIDHDDPLLAAAYAAAKVFVLPSFNEVMPLVVYEAAQAGCNLVLSNTFPCEKLLRDKVFFANPRKPHELRKQIKRAMSTPLNLELRKVAMSMPTWQDVANSIAEVYKELLESA